MLFTLEAVFAKHGDALILHYGTATDPSLTVIDGGPPSVYADHLRPRLAQLRERCCGAPEESLPLELVVVSHIDEDHITGILDLYDEELSADADQRPLPFAIRRLWHNSFDDLAGPTAAEVQSLLRQESGSEDDLAVVASVGQGLALRRATERLATGALNPGFDDLVLARAAGDPGVQLGHGLTFHVLSPTPQRIEAFRTLWQRWLATRAERRSAAEVAAMEDTSPSNLASIVVLAEMAGRRMLLTGDARGDDVTRGLRETGLMSDGETCRVDLLKVPHHGSSRNVDEAFFRAVPADHYVFSGDGRHGNPEPETLRMLAAARGDDEYTVHFTVCEDAADHEGDAARRTALEALMGWVSTERPPRCRVAFRRPEDHSIMVDLGDEALAS